jgi:hypothetical protein
MGHCLNQLASLAGASGPLSLILLAKDFAIKLLGAGPLNPPE